MKLLIVDDHAGVRAMIRQLAQLPDNAVRECASAEEALRIARDFAPDLVTMDVRLPGLSGFVAARALSRAYPHARVVMVTAHDQPELRHAALQSGATGYVVKDHLEQLRTWFAPASDPASPPPSAPASGLAQGGE